MNRLELTAPTTAQKVLTVTLAVLVGVVTGCLGLLSVGLGGGHVLAVPFGIIAGSVALVFGYLLLRMLRARTWLEGTVLAVRGAFTTRRCDLATARVQIGSRQLHTTVSTGDTTLQVPAGRMPVLQAQDPGTGKWLTVGLRDAKGNLLDPSKLRALVVAITAGSRPEPDRSHAAWAARGIQELASNPVYRLL